MGTDKIREENAAAAGARSEPEGDAVRYIRVGIECLSCLKPCYATVSFHPRPIMAVPLCDCGRTFHILIEDAPDIYRKGAQQIAEGADHV